MHAATPLQWDANAPLPREHLELISQIGTIDPAFTPEMQARDSSGAAHSGDDDVDGDAGPGHGGDLLADTEDIQNIQQFHEWFSRLEAEKLASEMAKYSRFEESLRGYVGECDALVGDVDAAMGLLDNLDQEYLNVTTTTGELRDACDRLLQEKDQLVSLAENIDRKLFYFDELGRMAEEFANPRLTVFDKEFVPLLKRCDECITYISNNSHFQDASSYLFKFRRLLSDGLQKIAVHVVSVLRSTTQAVVAQMSKIQREGSAAAADAPGTESSVMYVKFRTNAAALKVLIQEIEKRADNEDFQAMLSTCHKHYFTFRHQILAGPFTAHIQALTEHELSQLARAGCSYLVQVCQAEYALAQHFFSEQSAFASLNVLATSLCSILYSHIRPLTISQNEMGVLCELIELFKTEVFDELLQRRGMQVVDAIPTVIHRMLQDAQERLMFRAETYIQAEIRGFKPLPADLDYPNKLANAARAAAEGQAQAAQGQLATATSASAAAAGGGDDAGLQGMYQGWYPPLEMTLRCLSRLYLTIDSTIFEGLAEEALTYCTEQLSGATKAISKRDPVDGFLFLIKHLLILREQISPFEITFAARNEQVGFSTMISSLARMYGITAGPMLQEQSIDPKRNLELALRTACKSFILHVTKLFVNHLLPVLTKMDEYVERHVGQEESLRDQPFCTPEILLQAADEATAAVFKELPAMEARVRIYLENSTTRNILVKPIKDNLLGACEKLHGHVSEYFAADVLASMEQKLDMARIRHVLSPDYRPDEAVVADQPPQAPQAPQAAQAQAAPAQAAEPQPLQQAAPAGEAAPAPAAATEQTEDGAHAGEPAAAAAASAAAPGAGAGASE